VASCVQNSSTAFSWEGIVAWPASNAAEGTRWCHGCSCASLPFVGIIIAILVITHKLFLWHQTSFSQKPWLKRIQESPKLPSISHQNYFNYSVKAMACWLGFGFWNLAKANSRPWHLGWLGLAWLGFWAWSQAMYITNCKYMALVHARMQCNGEIMVNISGRLALICTCVLFEKISGLWPYQSDFTHIHVFNSNLRSTN
jgi:hypothetical protein